MTFSDTSSLCNLAFLATSVAFLAFMTLKHQNTESSSFLTPNEHKNAIKSKFFPFLTLWPLKWPLQPFAAFSKLSWASWCLLRQLIPENVKSLQKHCFYNFEINSATNSQCAYVIGVYIFLTMAVSTGYAKRLILIAYFSSQKIYFYSYFGWEKFYIII